MIRARCEVLSSRKVGLYHSVTIVAPEIADRARPGQFVEVGVPPGREFTLRRPLFIHQSSRRGGWAGTLELVFDARGAGTTWLSGVKAHQSLDVIGPLGHPFSVPREPIVNCLLVAEDYAAAPMYFLAEVLRAHGKRVDMVVGADTQERVFKPIEGKRLAQTIAIVTDDGSLGEQGTVVDMLPDVVERTGAQVLYAAGPRPFLRAVAAFCRGIHLPAQVAVEERMGCGLGMCWSCVVPVVRKDGDYDLVRSCIDGPVFNSGRIVWERWGEPQEATPPEGLAVVTEVDEA